MMLFGGQQVHRQRSIAMFGVKRGLVSN